MIYKFCEFITFMQFSWISLLKIVLHHIFLHLQQDVNELQNLHTVYEMSQSFMFIAYCMIWLKISVFLFDVRFQLSRFALGMKFAVLIRFWGKSWQCSYCILYRFKSVLRSTRLPYSRSTNNPMRWQSDSVVDKESLAKTWLVYRLAHCPQHAAI